MYRYRDKQLSHLDEKPPPSGREIGKVIKESEKRLEAKMASSLQKEIRKAARDEVQVTIGLNEGRQSWGVCDNRTHISS